jgi:hypothetical protein
MRALVTTLLNRLSAVSERVEPLSIKLAKLTSDQRAAYDLWHSRREERWGGLTSEQRIELFGRCLNDDDDGGPELRDDVALILFGAPPPVITEDMTVAQAAETYTQYLQRP